MSDILAPKEKSESSTEAFGWKFKSAMENSSVKAKEHRGRNLCWQSGRLSRCEWEHQRGVSRNGIPLCIRRCKSLGGYWKTLCRSKEYLGRQLDFLLALLWNVSWIFGSRSIYGDFELRWAMNPMMFWVFFSNKMMRVKARKERPYVWVGFYYWAYPYIPRSSEFSHSTTDRLDAKAFARKQSQELWHNDLGKLKKVKECHTISSLQPNYYCLAQGIGGIWFLL